MMTRSLFLALAILFLAAPAAAQFSNQNVIGITQGLGWYDDWCVEGPGIQVYTLYLYISDPYNLEFDGSGNRSVERIGGFELKLEAVMGATVLERRYPVPAIDVGDGNNWIVGYGEPVLVDAYRFAILAEVDVLLMPWSGDPSPVERHSPVGCENHDGELYLSPAYPPSIEGYLAYLDADDPVDPMVPAYWQWFPDHHPEMLMKTTGLPTDNQTLDGITAIYR